MKGKIDIADKHFQYSENMLGSQVSGKPEY